MDNIMKIDYHGLLSFTRRMWDGSLRYDGCGRTVYISPVTLQDFIARGIAQVVAA